MHGWTYRIDVSDLWTRAKAEEITAAQLGKDLAERLRGLHSQADYAGFFIPDYISTPLSSLAEDATFDDFDVLLERLYDWADYNKNLWIGTIPTDRLFHLPGLL